MSNTIDVSLLASKLNKSLDLLSASYRSKDGKGGWYHYLDSDKPGPTASAVGLMCFKYGQTRFANAGEVFAFLKSRQVVSSDRREHGGWAISMMPNQPSLEASGWVIKCLGELRLNMLTEAPDVDAAYAWLVNNQNDDYGWGSFYGQPSRTYLTCMALRAIALLNPFSEALLTGQQWLLANKNKTSPAWGATVATPPTILHTGYVLLTLAELNLGIDRLVISDALNWVTHQLNPNKAVEIESLVEDYDIVYIKDEAKTTYQNSLPHYALPVAISALLRHQNALDNEVVYRGLRTIVETQNENGYWENARNPTRISIWAIWPFLQTLYDAINLPVLSSAKTVSKLSDAIVIRTNRSKMPLLYLIAADFARSVWRLVRAYWSLCLLLLFIVVGLILTAMRLVRLNDFLLSLVLPLILVFVQLALAQRKNRR